jgi:hypothetical protein
MQLQPLTETYNQAIAPTTLIPAASTEAMQLVQPVASIPQPDANGEFACPANGAKFMASFGALQTPLNGKTAFLTDWQNRGSCDFAQIDVWAREFPGCNFGSIGKLTVRLLSEPAVEHLNFV